MTRSLSTFTALLCAFALASCGSSDAPTADAQNQQVIENAATEKVDLAAVREAFGSGEGDAPEDLSFTVGSNTCTGFIIYGKDPVDFYGENGEEMIRNPDGTIAASVIAQQGSDQETCLKETKRVMDGLPSAGGE